MRIIHVRVPHKFQPSSGQMVLKRRFLKGIFLFIQLWKSYLPFLVPTYLVILKMPTYFNYSKDADVLTCTIILCFSSWKSALLSICTNLNPLHLPMLCALWTTGIKTTDKWQLFIKKLTCAFGLGERTVFYTYLVYSQHLSLFDVGNLELH